MPKGKPLRVTLLENEIDRLRTSNSNNLKTIAEYEDRLHRMEQHRATRAEDARIRMLEVLATVAEACSKAMQSERGQL